MDSNSADLHMSCILVESHFQKNTVAALHIDWVVLDLYRKLECIAFCNICKTSMGFLKIMQIVSRNQYLTMNSEAWC